MATDITTQLEKFDNRQIEFGKVLTEVVSELKHIRETLTRHDNHNYDKRISALETELFGHNGQTGLMAKFEKFVVETEKTKNEIKNQISWLKGIGAAVGAGLSAAVWILQYLK